MAEKTRGEKAVDEGIRSLPSWYGERQLHSDDRKTVRPGITGNWRVRSALVDTKSDDTCARIDTCRSDRISVRTNKQTSSNVGQWRCIKTKAVETSPSYVKCEFSREVKEMTPRAMQASNSETGKAVEVGRRLSQEPYRTHRSTSSSFRNTPNKYVVSDSKADSNRLINTDNPVEMLRKLVLAEPAEALLALGSSRSGLFKFFTYKKIGDTRVVELLMKVMQNACLSSHSPQLLSHMLKNINESGFLNGPLLTYLVSQQHDLEDALVIAICNVLKTLLHHLPSSSLPTVTILLSQLSIWKESKQRNRSINGVQQDAIDAILNADELAKSTARQIRGGDLMRDQELNREVHEEEPPDDFRKTPTYPSESEIKSTATPFLRKNIIFGAYNDVDHYLDVQYRLLREDFVCPLREGLQTLQQYKENNIPLGRLSDIRFYSNVRVQTPYCTNRCVLYRISFDVSHLNKIKWESSKRLIFGSLVGLSRDDFKNVSFGTVAQREPEDLRKGEVDISFEDENAYLLDLNPCTEYQMIECSAYFEAYRHVLEGLQEINSDSLPFEKYILNKSQAASEVLAPKYLRGQNVRYNFSSLSNDNRNWQSVPVLDRKAWPSSESLGLDESQYAALQTAVMKEFVTIQGPPGTGKTFIGLKIAQLLLDNKEHWMVGNSPILVVCFTNHALDQFLEGIVDMCHLEPGQLVRVGGRCASEKLKPCSLFEIKKRRDIRASAFGHFAIAEVFDDMNEVQRRITHLVSQVECARTNFIHERYLQQYMTGAQAESFFNRPNLYKCSQLLEWLNIGLGGTPIFETDDEEQFTDDSAELILEDDEEEVTRIQRERQIEGMNIQLQHQNHLQIISEASKRCHLQIEEEASTPDQWEQVHGKKKHGTRKTLHRKVQRVGTMSMEEWMHTTDVWSLPMIERWRLYNCWVSFFCDEISIQIRQLNAEYSRLTNRLAELYAETDYQALRQAQVIGMTTTGAARCRKLLQRVRPKIVIVEEAAEVLEAHIVTTLSPHCQHLIMIGDHQQLRPNPTVYKLAKQYHLDISLFERMVKNDLYCDRLKIQHRMRPEIVKLIVPHIYKELENHESVLLYENVGGINGNLFFITHAQDERSIAETKSHSNDHEARFLTALCRYLLQQGYKPCQITVLTAYTGQMFLLRQMMPKQIFGGVRITPVDNYQGEENDIILLSLVRSNVAGKIGFLQIQNRVCVALSRAKKGLYVIGNMDVMADASSLWGGIVKDLEKHSHLVDALPLACQNHPANVLYAKTHEDFAKAPEGGCMQDCGIRLKCGHVCTRKCHPVDKEHTEYICEKPCTKILCSSGHCCSKKCYQLCGECTVLVSKTLPKCGHEQMVKCHVPPEQFVCKMPCEKLLPRCEHQCQNKCGQTCSTECTVIIADREWPCGHLLTVDCSLNPNNFKCTVPVKRTLPCGHTVQLSCSAEIDDYQCVEMVTYTLCDNEGHTHQTRCNQLDKDRLKKCQLNVKINCSLNAKHTFVDKCCDRVDARCPIVCNVELPCGHLCSGKCSSCSETKTHQLCRAACRKRLPCNHQCKAKCSEPCPPCRDSCTLECGHRKCSQPCGNLCDVCDLPCRWQCLHQRCELRCAEPCTRPPCDEPCRSILQCGHRCIGLCGEPCVPWCARCNKQNVVRLVQFLQVPNYTARTKFLHLKPCGHVVEVNYMDAWVKTLKRSPPYEPVPVTCPICKQRVGLCPRYNSHIKKFMIDVNTIKKSAMTTSRLNGNTNRVVKTFWPEDYTVMKEVLLTPDNEVDSIVSFTSVAVGALCIWQECWDLLQSCIRKDTEMSHQHSKNLTSLEGIKTDLREAVGRTDFELTAKNIVIMEMIYLNLQVCRLMSFIKNPRLLSLLESLCSKSQKQTTTSSMISTCSNVNRELVSNFNLKQRDNIPDYLNHFETFFEPDVTNRLQVQKWLICERGHAFGVTLESATVTCNHCISNETHGAEAVPAYISIHEQIISDLMKATTLKEFEKREKTERSEIRAALAKKLENLEKLERWRVQRSD